MVGTLPAEQLEPFEQKFDQKIDHQIDKLEQKFDQQEQKIANLDKKFQLTFDNFLKQP